MFTKINSRSSGNRKRVRFGKTSPPPSKATSLSTAPCRIQTRTTSSNAILNEAKQVQLVTWSFARIEIDKCHIVKIRHCVEALVALCRIRDYIFNNVTNLEAIVERYSLSAEPFSVAVYAANVIFRIGNDRRRDWSDLLSKYVVKSFIIKCSYITLSMPILDEIRIIHRWKYFYFQRINRPRISGLTEESIFIRSDRRQYAKLALKQKKLCAQFLSVASCKDFPIIDTQWFT